MARLYRLLFYGALVMAFPLVLPGQRTITSFRSLGQEEGLAAKLAYCGLTDKRGFVWLGTPNGLQRYDGERLKLLTREKNGLGDNNVVRLALDPGGMVWVLYGIKGADRKSAGKLDLLDPATLRVSSFENHFKGRLPFRENNIITLCNNERGELAIVTRGEGHLSDVFIYGTNKQFRKIAHNLNIDHDYPHHIIYRDTVILIYQNNKTAILYSSGKLLPVEQNHKGGDNFFPLGINRQGRIFGSTSSVGAPGKVYPPPVVMEINPEGKARPAPRQFLLQKPYADYNLVYFRALYESKSAEMLLYQQSLGFFLFNGETFTELIGKNELGGLHDLKLYDFFTLPDNQYAVCTSAGVMIIRKNLNHFNHLLSWPEVTLNSRLDHQVRSIYADSAGNVFINSWGGFFKASANGKGTMVYRKLMQSEKPLFDGFYFDGTDFWIASGDTQVLRYHPRNESLLRYEADSLRLWSGITTPAGQLIVGAVQGFGKFTGKAFERMLFCNGFTGLTPWVYQFFYSRDGSLWAVTNKGLFEIKDGNCIGKHYSAESSDPALRIPFSDLHYVFEDNNGVFWMATNGAGLIKWDRKAGRFDSYSIENGLSSNVLYAVLEDRYNDLWISSEFGLMRFNKQTGAVNIYTMADGITDNEFNRISFCRDAGGKLYFGGMNGVTVFDPADFRGDSVSVQIPLEIISLNIYSGADEKLQDKTSRLIEEGIIKVSPADRFFILDFQLLDYGKGKHHYAYWIEGYDKGWNYIENGTLRISGLPYGDYKLKIKGQGSDGQWSSKELLIDIHVAAPMLALWWVRLIIALLAALAIYLLVRIRIREINKSKVALERMVGERTRQLNISLAEKEVLIREIHHRVNNNLQVISGLLELEEKKSTDRVMALRMAEGRNRVRSIALIHQNLYKQSNVAAVDVNTFLDGLFMQVKDVFRKEGVPVQIQSEVPRVELDIETAVPLGLILNELLTNSFKYAFHETAAGKINIRLNLPGPGQYELIYTDNGPGLPDGIRPGISQTMGMLLIFDLARQIGGSIAYHFENCSTFLIIFTNNQYRKKSD